MSASSPGSLLAHRVGRRLEVTGTVQGVGFRPFVYRLANELGLDGWVRNAGGWVEVEAFGTPVAVARLVEDLRRQAPPRARVADVRVRDLGAGAQVREPGSGFAILESDHCREPAVAGAGREFPPDIATCPQCLVELFDPADRRYRYPFVNCTNCGPRATIIDDLPYDRARTSMSSFELCPDCAAEYHDPTNRRFHAEPVACPACGPRLSWHEGGDPDRPCSASGGEALGEAVAAIRAGRIVAVKGLGGYHLACDATNEEAVARLRRRKRREAKPFAVMVADLASARTVAEVSVAEAELLSSPARPIVLLEARRARSEGSAWGANRAGSTLEGSSFDSVTTLAPSAFPATRQVGLFLPYTPLHHLLVRDLGRPIVLTSGNLSDEPIVIDDGDAFERVGGVADGFLQHDRPIRARYEDSVAQVVASRPALLRRGRGYAPDPLPLPVPAAPPLLAAGAELKHTFALADGRQAWVGPHTGDLEDVATSEAFQWNLAHLCRLEAIEPEVVVHDLHPGYLSTQWAVESFPPQRRMAVQHHHAHVASCLAENGLSGPAIGVAYDGLGMGDDGTLWGGEVLLADLVSYRRFARFSLAPLPGGAAAVRRPARMALGYLFGPEEVAGAEGSGWGRQHEELKELAVGFLSHLDPREVDVVRTMVQRGINCPPASSAGRLFDAASSLLGLRDNAAYEGEAAVVLASVADEAEKGELAWRLGRSGGMWVYDVRPTLAAILEGVVDGVSVPALAGRFQRTVAAATVALCREARANTGYQRVCLSGGVFQNLWLATTLISELETDGFEVHLNRLVPANDGGISYGQAAIAACRLGERPPGDQLRQINGRS